MKRSVCHELFSTSDVAIWLADLHHVLQGIPLIMETPVQEREAPIDFKKTLEHGKIWWKDPTGPYGVGTDRRDIILLNSLVNKENWS